MDNTLQLKIITSLQDKLSGPLKKIRGVTGESAKSIKDLRDKLKDLESTQKNIQSFRKLSTGLKDTQAKMQGAQEKVRALSAAMQSAENPTKKMSTEFNRAVAEARKLTDQSKRQAVELQNLRSKLSDSGISTRNLSNNERELRTNIQQTSTALKQQTDQLRRAAEQQNKLANAKEKFQSTQQLASNMAITGTAGYMGGRKVLTGMSNIIQPGIEFDEKMSKVQSLTRTEKDSEALKQLRQQARDLGASTMFSATEAADAQGFLAMAGFKPENIIKAMPGLLDLSKAGDIDLGRTADIASNILTGMDMPADKMNQVSDVLTGAFTRSNVNLEMLGETMKYAAPIASALQVDMETLAAATGKLGDAGIQGGMAGTALRSILNRLSAPPKTAADALSQLGVKAKDAQGNLRNLPDILTDIYSKTKNMGDAQRAGLLKAIAGEEAVSAMQILVKQAGQGGLQEFIRTLKKTEGEAAKVAADMADNIIGDLDELSSGWEDLGISVFEGQNAALRELTQSLTKVVNTIGTWIKENPELTGTIVKAVGWTALLVSAFGGLAIGMAALLGPFAMIKYGMTLFGIKAIAGIGSLTKLAGAFKTVGLAILGMGKFLLANPIILIAAVIAGAAYLIYKNWDFLKAKFGEIWTGIKAYFSEGWDAVSSMTSNAWSSVSNAFSTAVASVTGHLSGFWTDTKAYFSNGFTELTNAITQWNPVQTFQSVFSSVSGFFGGLVADFSGFGRNLIQGLVDGIKGMAGQAKEAIENVGSGVVGWFKDKLGINSPSRVFVEMGGYISEGAAVGIERHQSAAMKAAKNMAASVMLAGAMTPIVATGAPLHDAGNAPIRFDNRAPLANTSMSASVPATAGGDHIEIHIHAAGMNPQDIARAVSLELDRRQSLKQSRRRSAYVDYGN